MIEPMLAKLTRELPVGAGLIYEPKWDGFRCIAYIRDGEVEMHSRNGRPLARYFPEIVEALRALPPAATIDGEIVIHRGRSLDFAALLQRLHPAASRVTTLSRATPATFIAFDVLQWRGEALLDRPFGERRAVLNSLPESEHFIVTPATTDPEVARSWLDDYAGSGLDGVVVKDEVTPYTPGKRTMRKVKRDMTADCVVAGFRWHHTERAIGSLLLGLYDDGVLRHVGLASSFTMARRRELLNDVAPYVTELETHPWREGFNLPATAVGRLPGVASRWADGGRITWVPLRPELVCELSYDHWDVDRFRHPPRFIRWRRDRGAQSCGTDQFADPVRSISEVLPVG